MNSADRPSIRCRLIALAAFAICSALIAPVAQAQVFERSSPLPPADIERMEPSAATHLENADRFLAEKQWDEAIEAIRRVMESDTGQFVPVSQRGGYTRWIPLREFCQQKLAGLADTAPEALARYRALVDPLAEQWYRQAVAERREDLLRRIIDLAFASQWGDDALLLAGEFRLQAGDHAQARADWQRISPLLTVPTLLAKVLDVPAGSPLWLAVRRLDWDRQGKAVLTSLAENQPFVAGHFPDTALDLADVRAKLILVSILEGSLERAAVELELLGRLHPDAEGQVGGRSGKYVQLLSDWLAQAKAWGPERPSADWPTFAGNVQRTGLGATDVDIAGQPTWTYELPRLTSDHEVIGASRLRVADDMKGLLSTFPIVVDGTVLVRAEAGQKSLITALDLKSGERRWEVDYQRRLWALAAPLAVTDSDESDAHQGLSRHVGVARFTLSAADGKLFARMGSPVSGPASRTMERLLSKDQGWLLGLDLQSEGKPLEGFPIRPESAAWSFEGTPIYERGLLYVCMRRADGPRAQLHVACFDLPTGPTAVDDSEEDSRPSGRMRWRTKLVSAAPLGGGDTDEIGHTLLTLTHGKIYCNTNLGAVASLDASSGKVDWITTYPRAAFRSGDAGRAESHLFRDLNPCMIAKDFAIVAPCDAVSVFAVELASGNVVWNFPPDSGGDVVHLLGQGGDVLNVSGEYLYWVDLQNGNILAQYPKSGSSAAGTAAPSPRGFGRGIISGGHVYWPTRESIYVFRQKPVKDGTGWQPHGGREIQLASRGATGGNLVISQGVLLIASGDRLYAFDEQGPSEPAATTAAEVR